MTYQLLIKNGTCLTPAGQVKADVAIKDGTIVEIGEIDSNQADKVIDASGLHVLPGMMDTQVHFREPGNSHKENLETGSKGAILGGITTVFDMPNTSPAITSKERFEDKMQRAKDRMWTNYAFYMGASIEDDKDWRALEQLPGCCGIKIFLGSSTGNLLVDDAAALRRILSQSKRRCAVHCEDETRLKERHHLAVEGAHAKYHPVWRDEETALTATKRIVGIAREFNHPLHILHITTAEEMVFLAENKDICTVEVLPQHLTFTDADYEQLGNYLQMNPPIRAKKHQDALWRAIDQGVVDIVGSDHAPHTKEEKEKPYPQSPAGLPGVQTILPIMLDHVHHGKLTLERLVDLMAHSPNRIFQMKQKGRLVVGYDADITLVDLKAKRTIESSQIASLAGWTPYDKKEVTGWPTHTIIGGNVVMEEDKVVGQPIGRPVEFIDTL